MTSVLNFFSEGWAYLTGNWWAILVFAYALHAAIEAFSKLTPTKSDDTFAKKYKESLDWVTGFIPNVKKKPGTKMTPDGVHEKKE